MLSVLGKAFTVFFLPKTKGRIGEADINFWARRILNQVVFQLTPGV